MKDYILKENFSVFFRDFLFSNRNKRLFIDLWKMDIDSHLDRVLTL